MNWKMLIDDILDVTSSTNNTAARRLTERKCRFEFDNIANRLPLDSLRATLELDFTSADSDDGIWLPSDLRGIERVRDQDNGFEFYSMNKADAFEPSAYGYRYFTYLGAREALFSGTDLVVAKGGTSFTSSSLVTAIAGGKSVDGFYAKFATDPGLYLIDGDTSPFDFSPTFYGDNAQQGELTIRPPNTKKMRLLDQSENAMIDRTVDVYYWRSPWPLLGLPF